jgi:hypothetical protein
LYFSFLATSFALERGQKVLDATEFDTALMQIGTEHCGLGIAVVVGTRNLGVG